ncbi:MAG: hypothetical protein CVV27_05310 [Candidatus Melainabacteria bacterium HGW-Melainabacteria-1]|nr:MAG: hypothetical protein CVV27_05310 [Candidatus Melainabacteria bacterium HGW-Melainabacteria-1]
MKIAHHLAALGLALGLATAVSGCGQFTNIPAQIKLSPSENMTATVTYSVDQDRISADVKNPKIGLEGEAGSIGVTYTEIGIEYLPASLSLNPRTVVIAGSIRVPSSHQFVPGTEGTAPQLVVGKTVTEIPVISSHVVQLGNPLSQGRINSQISAKVTLRGTDDAGFPATLEFFVPINFLSSALPTT